MCAETLRESVDGRRGGRQRRGCEGGEKRRGLACTQNGFVLAFPFSLTNGLGSIY